MSPSLKQTTDPTEVRVRLYRFDPEADRAPRYESYVVPYTPRMRIMDALDYIHETEGVDFGYRWLCDTKKCGTCAINVNGSPKLACWEEAESEMTIEPLKNLPPVRDLVTSRDGFEATLAKLSPLVVRKEAYAGFPEPLVALAELAQDPRDGGDRARLADEVAHVFKCVSCYECERVCPVEIPIVSEAIEPLKRLAHRSGQSSGARRARAFVEVVKTRGYASGALVALKTNGLSVGALRLALRLLPHHKLSLVNTFLKRTPASVGKIRKTYESSGDAQ